MLYFRESYLIIHKKLCRRELELWKMALRTHLQFREKSLFLNKSMSERERGRERGRERQTDRQTERERDREHNTMLLSSKCRIKKEQ